MTAPPARLRVFLVEDSAMIRESLVAALEEMTPVEVVGWADEEATARRWLEQNEIPCELIVVDIFLRRGSGLGLLQWLSATARPVRRVVLSSYVNADVKRRCLALGAEAVFDKPNEVDGLIEHCRQLAEHRAPPPAS